MGYGPHDCLLCYLMHGCNSIGHDTAPLCLSCIDHIAANGKHVTQRVSVAMGEFLFDQDLVCDYCGCKSVLVMMVPDCGEDHDFSDSE